LSETLTIKNLGPIGEIKVKPKPLTILIGEQASGKSLVAQVLYFFRGLKSHLGRIYSTSLIQEPAWHDTSMRSILDGLRGVPFGYFANGTARLNYSNPDQQVDWKISVHQTNRMVRPLKTLAKQMDEWVAQWSEDARSLGGTRRVEQIFIPTERSLFTRLMETDQSVLYADYQPAPFREFAACLGTALRLYDRVQRWSRFSYSPEEGKRARSASLHFISECQKRALAGEAYVPRGGFKRWKWRIETAKGPMILPIEATASGQMEAWPFFAIACVWGAVQILRGPKTLDFYFEEPESHLHPRAQWEVMKAIVHLVTVLDHRFVITTHSPFVVYAVNNMIQRYLSYKGEVPEGDLGISPEKVAADRMKANSGGAGARHHGPTRHQVDSGG